MSPMMIELIGYLASILVAISLTMRSVLKLRLINLAGATFFTIYGWLIGAYPITAVNGFIILINLYYLREMFTKEEYFSPLEVSIDSDYLRRFLQFYTTEIQQFNPGFRFQPQANDLVFFVLRDMVPAGLFIASPSPTQDGVLQVRLDFVIPGYRDYKIGQYIYRQMADSFRAKGYSQLVSGTGNDSHAAYLQRMGFQPDPKQAGMMWFNL
jgi:hypothetical protein